MNQKKIIVSMGAEFDGKCFVRIDIRSDNPDENYWFYFQAIQSNELSPFYGMEIIDPINFISNLKLLEKEFINDKTQDNT